MNVPLDSFTHKPGSLGSKTIHKQSNLTVPVRTRLRAHTQSLLLLLLSEAVSVTDDERNDETELKKKVATIFLRATTTTTFRPSIKAVSKQNRELWKVVAVRVSSFFFA